jgi:AraC family transcriptional regulator
VSSWRGGIYLWEGMALFVGRAGHASLHAHHAVQITVAVGDSFQIRLGGSGPMEARRAAVIASDAPHQLDGCGAGVLVSLYLDPEGEYARRVETSASSFLSTPELARYGAALGDSDLACGALDGHRARQIASEILGTVGAHRTEPSPIDARVRKVLALLGAAAGKQVPLRELAAAVGLSQGRLGHLFREQTGLPVRRYLLWLRLGDAVGALAGGGSLTEAAHAAGFADSAHLSRTFRRMFGVAPSEVVGGARVLA